MRQAEHQFSTPAEKIQAAYSAPLDDLGEDEKELSAVVIEGMAALVEENRLAELNYRATMENVRTGRELLRTAKRNLKASQERVRLWDRLVAEMTTKRRRMSRTQKRLAQLARGGMNWWDFFEGYCAALITKAALILVAIYLASRGIT